MYNLPESIGNARTKRIPDHGRVRNNLLTQRRKRKASKQNESCTATVAPGTGMSVDSVSSTEESESDPEQETYTTSTVARKHSRLGPNVHYPSRTRSNANPFRTFSVRSDSMSAQGKVSKRDGRLSIKLDEPGRHHHLADFLGIGMKPRLDNERTKGSHRGRRARRETVHSARESHSAIKTNRTSLTMQNPLKPTPQLNIVIMVIGSRGDIQPFIKVGKLLKEQHGHRVRIATHPAFREFVESDCGLEFFSVGGDPSELMAFMVKNPGLIPSVETLRKGEVGRRRAQMAEMFEGFWRACTNSNDGSSAKDTGKDPFVADAIIANPPSFAHVHCAERLGCPLHIMFTFPYTPTQQFPHPLANIKSGNTDPNYANFMSYPIVEMMTWQGLGDLVNDFRVKTLGLDPVSTIWAPGQLYRMKVPYTYLWSPGLVPKPADWGPEISIAGFTFLDLASSFEPPKELEDFLSAGEPPIYIGFGSIVIDKPEEFTEMIFAAVKAAGVRAVLNKGWGGFGSNEDTPDYIHMLGNTPHDWLFPKCKAVVHHGGAGTTAIGLKCAKPTMIVPFFGDQQFWGSMVAAAKAGAHECVPHKQLTVEMFVKGIRECLTEEAQINVQKIADSIEKEGDGAENAVDAFHTNLPMQGDDCMRCSIIQDRAAVWQMKHSKLRLSALAAELLVQQNKISYSKLRIRRQYDWNDFQGSGGPITGSTSAIFKSLTGVGKGVSEGPTQGAKHIAYRASHEKRKLLHKIHDRERHNATHTNRKISADETNDTGSQDSPETAQGHNGGIPSCESQGQSINGTEPALLRLPSDSTGKPSRIKQELKHSARSIAASTQGTFTGSLERVEVEDTHDQRRASKINQDELEGSDQSKISEDKNIEETASQRPRNRHRNTAETSTSISTILSADPDESLVLEIARDASTGITAPVAALVKLPMNLFLGLANGFHNLPRLYGDTTVRRPVRISGFYSGLRAARNELTYGTWDAITGVVTQPYYGAKEDGAVGFAAGVGKGFGGLILKECAAIIGPFGYTMKGVHRELTKSSTPVNDIRRKRMEQGSLEVATLTTKQKQQAQQLASRGWKIMAAVWAEGERVKRGLWDPETNVTMAEEEQGRALGRRMPGSQWVTGVVGRIKYEREKEAMTQHGAFESVEGTKRALEARKEGKSYEEAVIEGEQLESKKGRDKVSNEVDAHEATTEAGVEMTTGEALSKVV